MTKHDEKDEQILLLTAKLDHESSVIESLIELAARSLADRLLNLDAEYTDAAQVPIHTVVNMLDRLGMDPLVSKLIIEQITEIVNDEVGSTKFH